MTFTILQQSRTAARNLKEPWRREKLARLSKLIASRELGVPLIKPRNVTLTLTTRCNLRCVMCEHWRLKPGDLLSFEDAKRYIDQVVDWGIDTLEISGGEPFLHPKIMEIIAHATSRGQAMNITTNAMILTPERIDAIFESTITRLQISIDGPDSETHDAIRGFEGSFDRIVETVRALHARRMRIAQEATEAGEAMSPQDVLGLNMTLVIQRGNFTKLADLYALAEELGFDSITYQPVNDNNLDITYVDPENPLRVPIEEIKRLDGEIDRVIALRRERVAESRKGPFVGNAEHYLESVKKYFRNEPLEAVKCYAGYVMAVISPDGKMWSCMGNYADLSEMSVEEAWHSAAMKQKRKEIKACDTPCLYPCYLESNADSATQALVNTILS